MDPRALSEGARRGGGQAGVKSAASTGGSDKNFFKEYVNFWTDPGGLTSDAYHAITGTPTAEQRRDQNRLINEQINAYKEQTNLTQQALNEAKAATLAEKRRVEEKQIRGLRNRSRGIAGLMNIQSTDNQTKLGTSGDIPSKLGT